MDKDRELHNLSLTPILRHTRLKTLAMAMCLTADTSSVASNSNSSNKDRVLEASSHSSNPSTVEVGILNHSTLSKEVRITTEGAISSSSHHSSTRLTSREAEMEGVCSELGIFKHSRK